MTISKLVLLFTVASAFACRQNPDCFFSDECAGGLACVDNVCIDPALADVNWQVNIQPIAVAKCQACHGASPTRGAPFPIVTYQDTLGLYQGVAIHERMAVRVSDVANPMPPAGAVMLSGDEINAIVEWSAKGAPQGPAPKGCDGGSCGGDGGPSPLTGSEVGILVMGGYQRADGPGWNAITSSVFFVDSGGEQLYQASLPGTPMGFLNLAGRPSGATPDPGGGAIVALSTGRSVVSVDANGPVTLADRYMGNRLNGPNDVVRRSDGTIYFTDPGVDLTEARALDFNGIFRIPANGGQPVAEWEGLTNFAPDGLTLSVDETQLYMSDSIDGLIRSFDVAVDGVLSNERAFTRSRGASPEGMTVDTQGNVYVATGDGIEVYSATGGYHGTISISGGATNVAFVGMGYSSLYVTTPTSVYVVQMSVTGVR